MLERERESEWEGIEGSGGCNCRLQVVGCVAGAWGRRLVGRATHCAGCLAGATRGRRVRRGSLESPFSGGCRVAGCLAGTPEES